MTETIKASRIIDIDFKKINIGEKKYNRANINYDGNNMIFQTPFLEVLTKMEKTKITNIYDITTLFRGDNDNKILAWLKFIENFEDYIIEQIEKNANVWFDKEEISLKTLIKCDEYGQNYIKWPVSLKKCIFIDENGNGINYNEIAEGDNIKFIVEIPYMWINNNMCGIAVMIRKMMIKKKSNNYNYEFDLSENSESEEENNIISILATEKKKCFIEPSNDILNIDDFISDNNNVYKPNNFDSETIDI